MERAGIRRAGLHARGSVHGAYDFRIFPRYMPSCAVLRWWSLVVRIFFQAHICARSLPAGAPRGRYRAALSLPDQARNFGLARPLSRSFSAAAGQVSEIEDLKAFESAMEANKSKLVVAYHTAAWCGPCKVSSSQSPVPFSKMLLG